VEQVSKNIENIVQEKEKLIAEEKFATEQIAEKTSNTESTTINSKRILKGLKTVKQLGEVGVGLVGIWNAKETNDAELEAFDSAIETQGNNIKELKKFEMSLYTNVIPQIQTMGNNLRLAGENMKNQSQIALQVGKWKVQELIKDLSFSLKKISNNFDLQEDLLNIVDNLDSTMGLLVEVFDRIQV